MIFRDKSTAFDQKAAKRMAAERALGFVTNGMRLGLGTGSTASIFVELLGRRVAHGLQVTAVPTSERTGILARQHGIALSSLDETPQLDLTIDGADEYDSALRLIKGGGGALLREKITAVASRRMIVIVDQSKQAEVLGRFPLPVEVNRFGLAATQAAVERAVADCGCKGEVILRRAAAGHDDAGNAYVTDGGHLILDCHLGRIDAPDALAAALVAIPGVVEHGLFIGIATAVVAAGPDGTAILGHPDGS